MIASTTSTPEAPPATTATPTGTREAPEPSGEKGTTSTEPGPSRASSPALREILGRLARIAAEPHADDAWSGVLAAVTDALRCEVAKARAADEARINEGWVLLHQATERCRLLD
jgi:hypothetical protein